ncbi:MAG: FAD-dependent oxidoreductase [candidate division WS1 bacterium]|nr:FAD-dependent oxidoreductase [candidate division WS1 bacterium]
MIPFTPAAGGAVHEPARDLPVESEYDVVVVGGGPAGVGAAITAARHGASVLLVEQWSCLGGLATLGLVNIPIDFVSAVGREMFAALEAVDGIWHRNTDPEKHKLILDRMVRGAQVDLLFHTRVVESLVKDSAICGVVVENISGRQAILAKRVVDCSGDGDAAAYAGCEWVSGRESDGLNQGVSTEFRLGGVDFPRYQAWVGSDPKWLQTIQKALEAGDLPYEVDNHLNWLTHVPGRPQNCGMDEVSICLAHSRNCNTLSARDLTRIALEGREQVDFLWAFIRKYIPGFENSWLIDTGPLLGVRDSRRILGEYVMTARDLATLRKQDDVVACSTHGYDVHNPDGVGNIKWAEMEIEGETRYVICHATGFGSTLMPPDGAPLSDCHGRPEGEAEFEGGGFYDIPYRCLVPLKVENLLVAGRCLSADFMAQSGCRLIMVCLDMGQAAGTAAALSLQQQVAPRQLPVADLQRTLVASGMYIGQDKHAIPALQH